MNHLLQSGVGNTPGSTSASSFMHRIAFSISVALAAVTAFALWPVCVPVHPEQVAGFQPPISERSDSYLFGRVFQQRDEQWYQCKTRVARVFFF